MTSFGGGTCTVRKTRPCGVSSMPLLPLRICFSRSGLSGSAATSAAFTSLCSPVVVSVTTTAARRAVRSVFSAERVSSFTEVSIHFFYEDADRTAAGQADLPGGLVRDAKFERLRLAAFDHVERLGHNRALDAATRDRADEVALPVDDEVRADWPRGRAPGLDHGGDGDLAAFLAPVLRGFENVLIAREHVRLHSQWRAKPSPS